MGSDATGAGAGVGVGAGSCLNAGAGEDLIGAGRLVGGVGCETGLTAFGAAAGRFGSDGTGVGAGDGMGNGSMLGAGAGEELMGACRLVGGVGCENGLTS